MNQTRPVPGLIRRIKQVGWLLCSLLVSHAHAQLPVQRTTWFVDQPTDSIRLSFGVDSVQLSQKNRVLNGSAYRERNDTIQLTAPLSSLRGAELATTFTIDWLRNGTEARMRVINQSSPVTPQPVPVRLLAILTPGTPAHNWSYLDLAKDSVPGVSLYKAYTLLANRASSPVVVGVIDTGLDEHHEDLKDVLWTNTGERPGDGLDNDHNGYIDDIHGWYWLRFSDGNVLEEDQVEATRLYVQGKEQFDSADESRLPAHQRARWQQYQTAKQEFLRQRVKSLQFKTALADSSRLATILAQWQKTGPVGVLSMAQLESLPAGEDSVLRAVRFVLTQIYRPGQSTLANLAGRLVPNYALFKRIYTTAWQFSYNPDYKPLGDLTTRSLVGSGLPPSTTGSLYHGSLVSGIIGSVRENGKGIDGVADNVRIMNLGAAPANGDERDEYIAKAIRYAVDNGATIVNISLAKRFSPNRHLVDAALIYAEKRDVLIINCAGNDSDDTDTAAFYPLAKLVSGRTLSNFVEVGNSSFLWNEELVHRTSNYGATTVDLFAPGTLIRTTAPESKYGSATGTSLSAPLVAGIAALLKSYFPELTASAIKDILCESVYRPAFKVTRPGSAQKVPFSQLCRTGGIVNAYEAIRLTIKRQQELGRRLVKRPKQR